MNQEALRRWLWEAWKQGADDNAWLSSTPRSNSLNDAAWSRCKLWMGRFSTEQAGGEHEARRG